MANISSSPTLTNDPEPVSSRRLNVISLVLVLGVFTTLLDTTIVNIALDHLHTAFNATVTDTQWIMTAYLLAYVAVIPISGWTSERFGTRRVWMFAVAVFMLGSLLCGFADSLPTLIAFRALQGLGGGMVFPLTITLLTRAAGKDRLGRAIATIGLIAQIAPILGPIAGGSIVESIGWHWLFFINIPLCLAALVLAPLFLPREQAGAGRPLDIGGLLLLTPGVVALAFGISQVGGVNGFAAVESWLPLILGASALLVFTLRSLRSKTAALIDVRVFSRRSFGIGSVITFVSGFSIYALIFLLPLFYQQLRGNSIMETGFLLIPQGLGTICFILCSRHLVARIENRLVIVIGVLATMVGILPFALDGLNGANALLLAGQFLQGFGMAAVSLPVMTLAFTSLSHAETPRGSAAFSIVQRVGAPFGVTVIAVLFQHFLTDSSPAQAFSTTFWWIFALSAVPLILAFFLPSTTRDHTKSK
ncbi:MDR family MFS transporter [Arthrobacter cryoconiti]|uniref:MDR family MFS transporter n=1 Tax=Arthrobacter cryoconiti TaxID=748907 RepID=A0ABV8QYL4_9MICC|nr:MDR family MFS transporter [Arthrobacter cryoconiti]MCC9067423.1 multidrug efflux MFS transporter [Arthrobacter cryoconiti]